MEVRARRNRAENASPDRARVFMQPKVKAFRKVQVIYYLSRNGHLEHPHFMEVTHLASQQFRLKDVMDRLTVLRGKGMPSLYSWSCKRSYKNGFVWSDLAENDVIHPSEGAEYVLKGSELIEGSCASSERFQRVLKSNAHQIPEPYCPPRRKPVHVESQYRESESDEEEEEEDYFDEKRSNSSSNTPNYYKCSRGVSTDEIEEHRDINNNKNNENRTQNAHITQNIAIDEHNASPPNSTSSMISDKTNHTHNTNSSSSQSDHHPPLHNGRSSVLLQLIACGSSSVAMNNKPRPTTAPSYQINQTSPNNNNNINVGRKSNVNNNNNSNLHKGVLCKTAKITGNHKTIDEDDVMINYMSENPRFGNPQSEEKEYFSGSIVDSITEEDRVATESTLKKSSSYNEERSAKAGLADESERAEEKAVRGKCLPRKKISSKQGKK